MSDLSLDMNLSTNMRGADTNQSYTHGNNDSHGLQTQTCPVTGMLHGLQVLKPLLENPAYSCIFEPENIKLFEARVMLPFSDLRQLTRNIMYVAEWYFECVMFVLSQFVRFGV